MKDNVMWYFSIYLNTCSILIKNKQTKNKPHTLPKFQYAPPLLGTNILSSLYPYQEDLLSFILCSLYSYVCHLHTSKPQPLHLYNSSYTVYSWDYWENHKTNDIKAP